MLTLVVYSWGINCRGEYNFPYNDHENESHSVNIKNPTEEN